MSEDLQTIATIAAIASAVAALGSVVAAIWGPSRAAKIAEKLRLESQDRYESLALKRTVFNALMQERANLGSRKANRSLNLAVVAFADVPAVREKISSFHRGISDGSLRDHTANEALIDLLNAMATEIQIPSALTSHEIANVFGSNG